MDGADATRVSDSTSSWLRILDRTDAGISDSSVTVIYSQSLPAMAPYPESTLADASTLPTRRSAKTYFLYSWPIAVASSKHYAPIDCYHASFDARVGRAIACRSWRLPCSAEHGIREERSYTLRALRASSK